ncbi:MAG: ABC-type sugar transport system, permease component [Glaciihabitans sp.]|nr:ABC-type sugar transport system, permease component [Glaciihabitans sp.]
MTSETLARPERPATPHGPAAGGDSGSTPPKKRKGVLHRTEARGAWTLMSPYLLLLLVAGIIPIGYALVISLQRAPTPLRPEGGFGGFQSFITVLTDYRFVSTMVNTFSVLLVWLPIMMVGIIGLALLVHASPGRFGNVMRFIYYVPGALAGIANFVLWVYLLNPGQSPIAFLWEGFGLDTIKAVAAPDNLPVILAGMLFFQGVGTWIVIVNGGLNGISDDIFEAASLDGANAWHLVWHIKLPLIRPWIGYAALMNLAYGFQLFLEPYLLDQVASGAIADQWTPSQLGYAFAFSSYNFPAAAAMSIILLVITLGIGLLIVFRSGLFGEEEK